MGEYFRKIFERREAFNERLIICQEGKLIETFMENSIAKWFNEFPLYYFEEFCELYFSPEMCQRIKASKIKSIYQLKRYVESPL